MSTDFERLMLGHLDAAYALAVGLTRDDAAAQDIVQDSYVRAFRAWDRFIPGNDKAWLLTIVRRQCLTWLKQRGHRHHVGLEDDLALDDYHHLRIDPDQEATLIANQTQARVRSAVAGLAPAFREVIILKEFEDMAYKDIARVLAVPVGTVMSRLSRARDLLRHALTGDDHA